jgi:pectinesterase
VRTTFQFLSAIVLSASVVLAEDRLDVEYGKVGTESLRLDAHVPDGPGPFPIVLVVHGGGWSSGDKADWTAPFLDLLTKAGDFTWFSINYRPAPAHRWPACLEDVQTAVRWVKTHAKEFKGDSDRLALLGYSAGGHLVCQAAVLAQDDTRVQAVVGFAPPTDHVADSQRREGLSPSMTNLLNRAKTLDEPTLAVLREISPLHHVKPGLPPFLLVHGTDDKSVPYEQSVRFQAKLRETGVPCDLITINGAPHRITEWTKLDPTYPAKVIEWLRRTLIKPDIMVPDDFKTIHEAVQSVPRDNRQRTIIFIRDGVYREKVRIDADYVTLRGQSRHGTRIEFAQGNEEFTKQPDDIGRAVVNINGNDCVIENLTIQNTHGVVGPHAFAVYGKGDRTVIVDCDVLSDGADTLSLWRGESGRYYQARCNFRGSVDFVCPRGWCYLTDCTFYEMKRGSAAVWHDGSKDKDMKFVMRNSRFDGVPGWVLARHHVDAAFYFLDCRFSQAMADKSPQRVIYRDDPERNAKLDKQNLWGERAYFYNCHREGGDYDWHTNNIPVAPEQVTAAWTFAGKWDPERRDGPKIQKIVPRDDKFEVVFSENVTVKGKPRLILKDGKFADYVSGSGTDTLIFALSGGRPSPGGVIIATEASVTLRIAELGP